MGNQDRKKEFCEERIKAAVFDLDETILHHRYLSVAVHSALKKLKEKGIILITATGRTERLIPKELEDLFAHKVVSNGARVYAEGKVIKEASIERGLAMQIAGVMKKYGGTCLAAAGDTMLMTKEDRSTMEKGTSAMEYMLMENELLRAAEFTSDIIASIKDANEEIYKLDSRFKQEKDLIRVLHRLSPLQKDISLMVDGLHLEITAAGVSKAWGLKALSGYIGIPVEEMAAFGDSPNDFEMLKIAGYAVAMDNANDSIKEVADYIAPSAAKDGAAKAIGDLFQV